MEQDTNKNAGTDVPAEESAGPDSDAAMETKRSWSPPKWYLKLVSLVVVILAVACLVVIINGSDETITDAKIVHAQVEKTIGAMRVVNLDDFDWPSANIFLNGTSNYVYQHTQTVKSGETLTLPVAWFVGTEGKRFDPRKYEINEVWVQVPGYDLPCYEF